MSVDISYCIALYNGAKHLRETLESILAQDHSYSFEIVISDDASSDESVKLAREILENRAHYTMVSHEPMGIGANWNNSIKHAQGDYIALIGQDDVIHPHFTKVLREHIDTHKLTGAFGWRNIIDGGSNPIYTYRMQIRSDFPDIIDYKWVISNPLLYGSPRNFIGEPCCFLFHRSHFEQVGYFDLRLQQMIDFEYWLRSFKLGKVGCIRDEVCSFRMHAHQATETNTNRRIVDSYRLPLLLLQQHGTTMHVKTRRLLQRKLVTGWIKYFLLRA